MTVLGALYMIVGVACVAFYFVCGFYSRFGLSIQWIWLAAGGAFILAALSMRAALPQWVRWAWRALVVAALALLIGLESLVISGMNAQAPPGMDYLIVLGASVYQDGPSPGLMRRINAVTAVLDRHPDAVIIASGGQGKGEPISEAQCIRDELVKRGVDPARIVMEDRSTNTLENIAFSRAIIGNDDAKIGIVTNNYHVWRALRLAKRAGLKNAYGIASEYTGPTLTHFMVREAVSISVAFLKGNL